MFKRLPKFVKWILGILAGLLAILALLFLFSGPATVIDRSNPVGLIDASYFDESRDRQIEMYIWYPTNATETVELFEDNAVFRGFSAILDAPMADGKHPLVIFSHGSGGNRANQSWLAVELARQGAIVVAVNHPGSMSMDSAPATNILTWNRPEDISFVLDSLLADSQFAPHIDDERIAMVGHSLGGYTTLAIGGADLSLDQFIAYCEQFSQSPDCQFYRSGEVDLALVDRGKFEQSNRDERVSAIAVIDPAFARSFQPDSLQTMANTLLIAPPLDAGEVGDLQVDYLAEQLALGEGYIEMDGAHHFTYLPECKPLGYYILMVVERDGELLCTSESGKSRAEYHDATAQEIVSFLEAEDVLGLSTQ